MKKKYILIFISTLALLCGCSINNQYKNIVSSEHTKINFDDLVRINKIEEYNTSKYPYRTENDFSENTIIIKDNYVEIEDGYSYGTFRINVKEKDINYMIVHDGKNVYLDYNNGVTNFKLYARDDDSIYNLLKNKSISYNDSIGNIQIKVLNALTYEESYIRGVVSLNNIILSDVYSDDDYNYIRTECNDTSIGLRREYSTFTIGDVESYTELDLKELKSIINKLVKFNDYSEVLRDIGFVSNTSA